MITTPETAVSTELAYAPLVDEQLFGRLVTRIVNDEEMERPLATRVMNEALGFLALCAVEPEEKHSPSETVDVGWHTFLMYTREYADFSERVAGRFLHHEPTDVPGVEYAKADPSKTMEAMAKYGPVDEMLWTAPADCNDSGCHGGGCNQS